jgi:thiol-disulfide isomerase/thioredoxin
MLKIKSVHSLLIILFSLICFTQTAAANIISGKIKNLSTDFLELFLEQDINRKKSKHIARIPVDKNGVFKFEKKLFPNIYTLKISNQNSVMLAVDKGQHINITGDAFSPKQLEVTGSDDTRKLRAYEVFRKESLDRLVNSVRTRTRELKKTGAGENDPQLLALTKLEVDNYELHRDELIEFIRREMDVSLAVYPTSIRWSGEKNIPFLIQLARSFEQKYPKTEIAARVTEKVKVLKSNAIGGKVAEIKMPDKTGHTVSLASVKAKYILIDFWASWCAPCRRESGLLRELYQTFKQKGFEIFGVGLDSGKEAWLKAIELDERTWINVSTFREFETPAAFDYAVTSIPANILVDGSGKVIAKNLHGNDLKMLIEKLFSTSIK